VARRFSRRVVFMEDPEIVQHLQRVASETQLSASALVRVALRRYLAAIDPPRRAR
jgi:predicted transcriptional regulator